MAYLNRKNIGKFWAIPRKGTAYLAVSSHNKAESMPLVVVMREILNLVSTKKELKKLLNEKQIKINGKEIKETNYPVCLFDVIHLKPLNKNFKAVLSEQKKMVFEEVEGKKAETKVFKVMSRKILPGKKVQLNLNHGRNLLSDKDVAMGDSIVLNLVDNKILDIIKLEKGKEAFVIKGKHAGFSGKIDDIIERGGKKLAKISTKNGKLNVWVKNIIVVK